MGWRDWTGVGERRWKTAPNEHVQPSKTLWDLLQLLIVPVILVGVTFVWSASQTRSDNTREDRRIAADRAAAEEVRQDATLSAYIEQMSNLMLHEGLLTAKLPKRLSGKPRPAVTSVARTLTLTTLRRIDGERRGEVVRFLEEADLITYGASRVNLAGADIQGAHLAGVWLHGVDFTSGNLKGARLAYATLEKARLESAKLQHADLTQTDLTDANLFDAKLTGANLTDGYLEDAYLGYADLTDADLTDAYLAGADLTWAYLMGADLRGADFRGADLTNVDLTGAELRGADFTGAKLERVKGLRNANGRAEAKGLPEDSR